MEAGVRAVPTSRAERFVTDLAWADLPAGVVERATMCLVDTLGATLAGRPARASQIASDLAEAWWPAGSSHLLVDGERVSAVGAAFANAVTANAVDIDDCGIYTWGHPGAQVVPTAIALAEQEHLDGRELLTALAIGYEIAFRAGRCLNFDASKIATAERTYRACGSWGSIACAAMAAHVYGLDEEQTRNALGIAEYDSPDLPMMRDIDSPAMVKHGVGMGALMGLLSAELARRGFTGVPSSLDLERFGGFVEDLGDDYYLPRGITWKRFSSCAWTHPALLAVESLMSAEPLSADDIERIVVETYPDAVRLGTRQPTTTEEAQFSLAWPIAALILDGEVGPEQVLEEHLMSPAHRDLCARIEARVSEEMTRLYYLSEVNDPEGKDAAIVSITLRDGRVLSSGPVENVLYPEPGWGRDDIETKFRWLARGHLDDSAMGDIMAQLWAMASVDDVGAFMTELTSAMIPVASPQQAES